MMLGSMLTILLLYGEYIDVRAGCIVAVQLIQDRHMAFRIRDAVGYSSNIIIA